MNELPELAKPFSVYPGSQAFFEKFNKKLTQYSKYLPIPTENITTKPIASHISPSKKTKSSKPLSSQLPISTKKKLSSIQEDQPSSQVSIWNDNMDVMPFQGQSIYIPFTEFNWLEIKPEFNDICDVEEYYIPIIFNTKMPFFKGIVETVDINTGQIEITIIYKGSNSNLRFDLYPSHSVSWTHLQTEKYRNLFTFNQNTCELVETTKKYVEYCDKIYKWFLIDQNHPLNIHHLEESALQNLKKVNVVPEIQQLQETNDMRFRTDNLIELTLKQEVDQFFPSKSPYRCSFPLSLFKIFEYESNTIMVYGVYTNISNKFAHVNITLANKNYLLHIPPSLFLQTKTWHRQEKTNNHLSKNNSDILIDICEQINQKYEDVIKQEKAGKSMGYLYKYFVEYFSLLYDRQYWKWWSFPTPYDILKDPLICKKSEEERILGNAPVLVCGTVALIPLTEINWWESVKTNKTLDYQKQWVELCGFSYIQGDYIGNNKFNIPLMKYPNVKTSKIKMIDPQERDRLLNQKTIRTKGEYYHFTLGYMYPRGVDAYHSQSTLFKDSAIDWNEDILDEIHEYTILQEYVSTRIPIDPTIKTIYQFLYNQSFDMDLFVSILAQQYDISDRLRYTDNACLHYLIENEYILIEERVGDTESFIPKKLDQLSSYLEYQCSFFYDIQFNKKYFSSNDPRQNQLQQMELLTILLEEQTIDKKREKSIRLVFQKDLLPSIQKGDILYKYNSSNYTEFLIQHVTQKANRYYHPRNLLFMANPLYKTKDAEDTIGFVEKKEGASIHIPKSIYLDINLLISYADTMHDFGSGASTTIFLKNLQARLPAAIDRVIEYIRSQTDATVTNGEWADFKNSLKMRVNGKDEKFERKMLSFFNKYVLNTNDNLDSIDIDCVGMENIQEDNIIQSVKEINRTKLSIRLGNKANRSGYFQRGVSENLLQNIIMAFLGGNTRNCLINMVNTNMDIFQNIAYSIATLFDRGFDAKKLRREPLPMKKIQYHVSNNENELFEIDQMQVRFDDLLYMKETNNIPETIIDVNNADCRPKKGVFQKLLGIANDEKIKLTTTTKAIIEKCYPSVSERKPLLIDIKRAGDMLSSKSVQSWNTKEKDPRNHVIFVSGDYLAALKARFLGCPVITPYIDSGDICFDIYRPSKITIERNGGPLGPERSGGTTPSLSKLPSESRLKTPSLHKSSSNGMYSQASYNIPSSSLKSLTEFMPYQIFKSLRNLINKGCDYHFILLLWLKLVQVSNNRPIYLDRMIRNISTARNMVHLFDILKTRMPPKDFDSLKYAYDLEKNVIQQQYFELLEMPMHKEFVRILKGLFTDMDAVEAIGFSFKWDSPEKVVKYVLKLVANENYDWIKSFTRNLKQHSLKIDDLVMIRYFESYVQDNLSIEESENRKHSRQSYSDDMVQTTKKIKRYGGGKNENKK